MKEKVEIRNHNYKTGHAFTEAQKITEWDFSNFLCELKH